MEAASKFDCVQFMREAWARMDAETKGVADEGRLALGRGMFTQAHDWAYLKKMARDLHVCYFYHFQFVPRKDEILTSIIQ